jgi:hypothetical protein
MEEIDPAASEPEPLTGWALKARAGGGLVLYLEFGERGEGSLTLAVPSRAARHLADELARWSPPGEMDFPL